MLGKLLPFFLAIVGAGAGVGAGIALKAPSDDMTSTAPCGPDASDGHVAKQSNTRGDSENPQNFDYVKLNNQFVIPVVDDGRVKALVVLSLSLEIEAGLTDLIYEREPKLRDAFLQVLFDHANAGGFDGDFTNSNNMLLLRDSLREIAVRTIGPKLSDVLIMDLVRQDN